ncbi:hypothetical protein [Tardiphaga sp.]|uniref:hypothetical protein n=1 Tax=Tardiphaga sp. TaxID=1926292 RepID=UPI002612A583|nr:hypothetical protein [Tardiphaga sp.]MDB5619409.1 hypothetical protein [Tardiphaga sp.]
MQIVVPRSYATLPSVAFSTPLGNFTATGREVRIARSDGVVDLVARTVEAISTDAGREPA